MQSKHAGPIQIEALREEIARLEGFSRLRRAETIPSGCRALDDILPEGGFRSGTLVEWLAAGEGSGAATLGLLTAAGACHRSGGGVVVVDRSGEFYPPAAVRAGIDPERLIIVHAGSKADHHWALDQSLRCPAVAAVVAWPEAVDGKFDVRTFRRLQLAAEEGGGLGLLIRPGAARHQPSWADVRLLVEPLPTASPDGRERRLRIFLLRCRAAAGERHVEVEIDDETHPMSMAARA
jgi:protein ImuA